MQAQDESFQPRDRRPWTEEEDELLRMAIEEEDPDCNPPTRWHAISQHIPHRTNKDCRKRWWAQMATTVSKGSWTSDEDERLSRAVEELGPKWALVANRVRTRNSGQCAKRWNDALNPTIDRSGWTEEEDEQLLRAVEQHGHSWANIARTCLPGRTGLAAKNRYNHLMRGACRQAGRRSRRASGVSTRRRTRGGSESSIQSASQYQWGMSQAGSDGSESGTTPSTPRSIVEGDELHLTGVTTEQTPVKTLTDDVGPAPSLCAPYTSTGCALPADATDRGLLDLFGVGTVYGDMPYDAGASSNSYNMTSGTLASASSFVHDIGATPDLLGGSGQMDSFSLWSPCVSGPVTPIDSPFVDLAQDMTQAPISGMFAEAHGSLSSGSHPFKLEDPAITLRSPYMDPSYFDSLSHLPLDRQLQVAVECHPAFPDKASVKVTQPTVDPSDRRVAVAVAICDQQDILSTVQSLSHSLSTMLGQETQACSLSPTLLHNQIWEA